MTITKHLRECIKDAYVALGLEGAAGEQCHYQILVRWPLFFLIGS